MCLDPLTLGAMAAGGIGSAINASEANANRNAQIEARNKATNDELARQAAFQSQSGGIFDGILNRFQPPAQAAALGDAQTGATNFIHANNPMDVGSILTRGASPQAMAAENSGVASAFSRNAGRADALGKLTGYTNQGVGDALAMSESGRKLNTVSDASRGSVSLLPLARSAAEANAYRAPSGLGDLLGFAGNVGAFYSGRNGLPTRDIYAGSKDVSKINGMFGHI